MHNEEGKRLRNVYIITAYMCIVQSIHHTVQDKKKSFIKLSSKTFSALYKILLYSCIKNFKNLK